MSERFEVKLDAAGLKIDIFQKDPDSSPVHFYAIDLRECNTPAQVMDWLFQVYNKHWGPEVISDVFRVFEEASELFFRSSIQGVLCPGGDAETVEWNFDRAVAERLRRE